MKFKASVPLVLSAIVAAIALSSAANATGVARTWVSSTGNDANAASSCTRTSPCRTFAAAYSVTSVGGEIIALDSIGYGPVTISTSVSIVGLEGALISVQSNTTGVTVSAGASDIVILRNIQISGAAGSSNTKGIQVTGGKLVMREVNISRVTTGLSVTNTYADSADSDFIANTTAIYASGAGTDPSSPVSGEGTTRIRLSGGNVLNNATAYSMDSPGTNKANIFVHLNSNTSAGFTVNQAGNTTLNASSGTGCPCGPIGTYLLTSNQQGN